MNIDRENTYRVYAYHKRTGRETQIDCGMSFDMALAKGESLMHESKVVTIGRKPNTGINSDHYSLYHILK